MQKRHFVLALCLLVAATSLAWSASLEEAQSLESRGRRDAALQEIDDLLASDAPDEEMAGALDLLGTIAVDEGDLHLAYQSWNRLVGEYPDFAKALGATTKLSLVTSLMEAKGESPAMQAKAPSRAGQDSAATTPPSPPVKADRDETPTRTVAPPPAAASTPASDPAQDQAAKADSAEAAGTSSAVPSSQRSDSGPTSGTVLVAVSGKPYDAAVEAGEMVIAFLREQGVDAVSATEGIPVVRDASALVPVMVQRARDQGATSALLVDAEFPGRQKVSAQCYSPDGAQYWKTKVVGGTGLDRPRLQQDRSQCGSWSSGSRRS